MRELLKNHPHAQCGAAIGIEVAIVRPRSYWLELSYVVTGELANLSIPPVATRKRTDALWRHTCFEAFVRTSGAEYYEFNFAPTSEWAAYRFAGYRAGKTLAAIPTPDIAVHSERDHYSLQATLILDSLSRPDHSSWHLGLSAVMEDKSGRLSYWALAHASDKPDFHHPESFVYELSPVVPS
ncbi:MAG TPA: DOMON-like domain-containing protein [Pseudolabrys sp.]|nr:DOMON-like domain-containing protein [Pseudolabrys sp.]